MLLTNPKTNINLTVKSEDKATVSIYNLKGQQIIGWEVVSKGNHNLIWNGKDKQGKPVANGIYLLNVKTHQNNITRKISLIK